MISTISFLKRLPFVACCYGLSLAAGSMIQPLSAAAESSLVPELHVPSGTALPVPENPYHSGKPTVAAPSFFPAVSVDWVALEKSAGRSGDEKSRFTTNEITAVAEPAPVIVRPLAPVAPSVVASTVQPAPSIPTGSHKPVSVEGPTHSEVVRVSWAASRLYADDVRYASGSPAFQAVACPYIKFSPERMVPVRAVSRHVTDSAAVNADVLSDLRRLTDVPQESVKVTLADTYLAELQSLVQGPSVWLFSKSGLLLDLAPEEGNDDRPHFSYRNELQQLTPNAGGKSAGSKSAGSKSAGSMSAGSMSAGSMSAGGSRDRVSESVRPIRVSRPLILDERPFVPPSARGFYELVPEKDCETVGGDQLLNKFRPLSSIQLSGGSTAPPQRPSAEGNEVLNRPESSACAYLETASPGYYLTPTQFGVRRPNRTPQGFCHNPLYFEDPNLERCGQSNGCLTTLGSAIHFSTAIALTPYLTATTHPNACVQSLPDCATCHEFGPEAYFPRWSWRGAAAQAAAVTGIIFLFP